MSCNTECESDHVAVGGKAPVSALKKRLLGDLGVGAVWEEIRLPKGKVGSSGSPLGVLSQAECHACVSVHVYLGSWVYVGCSDLVGTAWVPCGQGSAFSGYAAVQ